MSNTLPDFLQLKRKPRPRQPMDERLPDGREVWQAVGQAPQPPAAPPADAADSSADAKDGREWQSPLAPISKPPAATPAPPAPPGAQAGQYDRRAAELAARRDAVVNTRNPKASHSRWWAALKEAGLSFAQGGIGGAIYGAIRGAVAPNIIERRERDREGARLLNEEQIALQRAERHARIDATDAAADYTRARPDIEAQKRAAAAAAREHSAILSNLRLLKGQRIDPANPSHAALLRRAADAGIEVDPESWNAAGSNLVPVDVVDPQNPTTKQRRFYNKATGELTDSGPQTGYVQPVGADGLTEAQRRGDADRDAAHVETHRHNVVTEGQGAQRVTQGDERIGIARDNAARRGEPTAANTNARLARASELARKLEEEKNRAAHPPRETNGRAWSEADRRAYTERHLQNARGYAQQINSAYPDLFEAGDGEGGWPYAKPKVQPNARPQGGAQPRGAYAGQRFSRAQLPEIRKRLGVSSDEEAERYVTAQGGIIY